MPLQEFWPEHECLSAVAQPPLPLQLFLPAQPASPVLQPPWPLQLFMPLQACLSPVVAVLLAPVPPVPLSSFFSFEQPTPPARSAATAAAVSLPIPFVRMTFLPDERADHYVGSRGQVTQGSTK